MSILNNFRILLIVSGLFVSSTSFGVTKKKLTLKDISIYYDRNKVTSEASKALIDERSRKLSLHQTMGHITAGLMVASFLTAIMAKNKQDKSDRKNNKNPYSMHRSLSYLTAASYYYTGYLSLTAPKRRDFKDEHKRKIHKHLAYIHIPMMILTPILGTIAYNQQKNNGTIHGIGKLARPIMYLSLTSFLSAWGIMTF